MNWGDAELKRNVKNAIQSLSILAILAVIYGIGYSLVHDALAEVTVTGEQMQPGKSVLIENISLQAGEEYRLYFTYSGVIAIGGSCSSSFQRIKAPVRIFDRHDRELINTLEHEIQYSTLAVESTGMAIFESLESGDQKLEVHFVSDDFKRYPEGQLLVYDATLSWPILLLLFHPYLIGHLLIIPFLFKGSIWLILAVKERLPTAAKQANQ